MAWYDNLDKELRDKLETLQAALRGYGRVAVAFSAGVDSTLLLAIVHDELGDDAFAVTARSFAVPAREIEGACSFCREEGIAHFVAETHEFEIEGFDRNPPNRCYLCKREILSNLLAVAAENGADVLVEGSNLDDGGDYRPGSKAVEELGVASPLRDARLTKADVRALARHRGLSVWDKPAFACLNTRFAYGDLITPEKLAMVDAAEEALRSLGFARVRVRVHDTIARIEVLADDIERMASERMRAQVVEAVKGAGFAYVALDLQGYRLGSMNEVL